MQINILIIMIFAALSLLPASKSFAAGGFITDSTPLWTTTDTNTTSATTSFAATDSVSLGAATTSQATVTPSYQAVRYGYDEFDRLKWAQHEDGTLISYDYDKVGNRLTKSVATGTTVSSLTITATYSGNGIVIPSGTLSIPYGGSQTFLIRANPGTYAYVKIDGVSVNDFPYNNCPPGVSLSLVPCQAYPNLSNLPGQYYTFQSVSNNHAISVEFITPNGDLNGDGNVDSNDVAIANSYIQRFPFGVYFFIPMPFNMLAHADVYSAAGYMQQDGHFSQGDINAIGLLAQGVILPPQTCAYYPARIAKTSPVNFIYYLSLQSAYDAAVSGDTIQANMYDHFESLLLDRNVSVVLDGGYTCNYTQLSGSLNVRGSMTIADGDITVANGAVVISNP